MKVVLAPDKFKGCLTAAQVTSAMAAGIRSLDPTMEIDECPMADGGEGTVDALVRAAAGGRLITKRVTGPLPQMQVDAAFAQIDEGRTAVIEMAAASGLHLLRPEQRDAFAATTFGTGELIRHAVASGARKIVLGIGGSATCDAGIGAAQACGFTILLRDGTTAAPTEPLCGRDLERVLTVKQSRGEVTNGIEILVACDVNNPLYGPRGAARVFAAQKGATPDQVQWLDDQLRLLAERIGRQDHAQVPGAGAAGGLGFGALAFFGATLHPGIEIVIEATRLRDRLRGADLCLTGEGRLDAQSLAGKTTIGVAKLCKSLHVPCIAIVGSSEVRVAIAREQGLASVVPLVRNEVTTERAMNDAPALIAETARRAVSEFNPS